MAGDLYSALLNAGLNPTQDHGKEKKGQNRFPTKRDGNNGGGYVGAPYNFVSQWETVVERDREACIGHDVLQEGYLSGEISYRFTAETDIAAGGEGEDFYRDPYGRYAIPGSSVRGMIRSHAQILSLSSIADDVDDYFLMFREVGGRGNNPNKKYYNDTLGAGQVMLGQKAVSVLKNVRAGYLVKEGKSYKIYRTSIDKINDTLGNINYYILSETAIAEDKSHEKYPFYWTNPDHAQHILSLGFKTEERNGRIHHIGKPNSEYTPYYAPVTYRISGERAVRYVGPVGENGLKGVALGTGKMKEKKCQYIIPEIDTKKAPIALNDEDVKAFRIDYMHKKKQIEGMYGQDNTFFMLPRDGEVKPVFYIEDPSTKRVYFGFTPRLRLFYKHSVKEGLSQMQREARVDYAKSLFGFSNKEDSYKTRLSFTDALAVSVRNGSDQKYILGEPSLSSYNDYLATDPDGNAVTYNMDGFRLRGVKQYWLRDNVATSVLGENDKVAVSFVTLPKGTVFEGKLRFHNLTTAELGLILWCIKLNPASRQQIGKAKAFGFGRIRAEITGMSILDLEKAYSSNEFSLSPMKTVGEAKIAEYVNDYKSEINRALELLGIRTEIDDIKSVKEFFAMRDSEHLADPETIRAMNIGEYRNRGPLQTVEDLTSLKP